MTAKELITLLSEHVDDTEEIYIESPMGELMTTNGIRTTGDSRICIYSLEYTYEDID